MVRSFLLMVFSLFALSAMAQSSDFIILKKRNKTSQTFFAGSNIEFITKGGAYRNGVINKIDRDTIYLQEFMVQRIPTTFGTYILDTAGSFRYAYNYRDIKAFDTPQKGFNVSGSGAALLGGGTILTLAGGVIYLADRDKFSPQLLIASAGLAVAGYFMSKSGSKGRVIGKRGYRIQYMDAAN